MELSAVADWNPPTPRGKLQPSAVLVPVIDPDDEPTLIFTKRADHLGDHPGQISFPGGCQEPSDDGLFATALREAEEEIGLSPETASVYGRLSPVETTTGFEISPFVARVPDQDYQPNPAEVAAILRLSISELLDEFDYERVSLPQETPPYHGHVFRRRSTVIWGATARILVQLLSVTSTWTPSTATR